MKKMIQIEGMHCNHCKARVEKALNSLDGVTASVDLKKGQATVHLTGLSDDDQLRRAVEDAGYTVASIEEKRGIFG